jgi:leucyl aminopeptidase (aminopeptidase T)
LEPRQRRSSGALSIDPASILREFPIEPAVSEGAQNALDVCLALEKGQALAIVFEPESSELAAAFLQKGEAMGARTTVLLADPRKATLESFARSITDQIVHADVSLFVGTLDTLPASFRHALITAGGARRRHGHMPGLTAKMMQQAMRTDYLEVKALSARLYTKLQGGATITVRTPRGTNLAIRCGVKLRWHDENGVLRGAGWTNLPAGELLTSPETAEGVLVPDGGAWDTNGQPVKNADRLKLTFEDGAVADIEGGAGSEPEALLDQLAAHEHGKRIGQIGFGTNIGVVAATGNLLQDLKMPGFHVTLGHTAPELTHAERDSKVEVPLLVRRPDVDVDGTPVLRAGRYVAPFMTR